MGGSSGTVLLKMTVVALLAIVCVGGARLSSHVEPSGWGENGTLDDDSRWLEEVQRGGHEGFHSLHNVRNLHGKEEHDLPQKGRYQRKLRIVATAGQYDVGANDEYGEGCFALSGSEAALLEDAAFYLNPLLPTELATNFACVRACSYAGYATALTYRGSECRCGNARLLNKVNFTNCNVPCTGARVAGSQCRRAYCCGSGLNASTGQVHVVMSTVGNIPVESVLGRQAANGIVERYGEFNQRWGTVSAVAQFRTPLFDWVEGNLSGVFVFQGAIGRLWERPDNQGSLAPWTRAGSTYVRFESSTLKEYNFARTVDVSDAIGGADRLACVMTTRASCVGEFVPTARDIFHFLWLVRYDGSFVGLVRAPRPDHPDRDRYIRAGLEYIAQQQPIFSYNNEWSWNNRSSIRTFPARLTTCMAVQTLPQGAPNSQDQYRDHYLLYLFNGKFVWTAYVGGGSPVSVNGRVGIPKHGPFLVGPQPRLVSEVWPNVPATLEPNLALNVRPLAHSQIGCEATRPGPGQRWTEFSDNLWLRGAEVIDVSSGTSNDATKQFDASLRDPVVTPPRPLEELFVEFVVEVPSRQVVSLCRQRVIDAQAFSCVDTKDVFPTTSLVLRKYTQGEARNVRSSPAPGQPDDDTYAISLSNPLPTDPSIPAPSQFMKKEVETGHTTTYTVEVKTGFSIAATLGKTTSVNAGGGVPGVAQGEATAEVGLRGSLELTKTEVFTYSWKSFYHELYDVTLEVPAGTCMQVRMKNIQRSAEVPWEATYQSFGFVRAFHQGPQSLFTHPNGTVSTVAGPVTYLGDYPLEALIPQTERSFFSFGTLNYKEQLVKQGSVFRLPLTAC